MPGAVPLAHAQLRAVRLRIRVNQSVLIVPGAHLGLEGYLRWWLGGKPEFLTEGLRRMGIELNEMEAHRRRARHG